ncbi:MAG: hypothetical protein R3C10_15780 [Pirellulales bacterium]
MKGIRVQPENYTHTLDNGLVLVAEPNPSLESAAFTFLLPAGCLTTWPMHWA